MIPADAKLKGTYKWGLGLMEENNVFVFCHRGPGKEQRADCYERMK